MSNLAMRNVRMNALGYGRPTANGKRHPITGSVVVLTIAHLDHQPKNCDDGNLRACCQRCHNTYDAYHRRAPIEP